MCYVYTFIKKNFLCMSMVMLCLRFSWTLQFKAFNFTSRGWALLLQKSALIGFPKQIRSYAICMCDMYIVKI